MKAETVVHVKLGHRLRLEAIFRFTLTPASWLNAVEDFFVKLIRQRFKRGVFRLVAGLELTINRFIAETNHDPKRFVWTADRNGVFAAVKEAEENLGQSIVLPSGIASFCHSDRFSLSN